MNFLDYTAFGAALVGATLIGRCLTKSSIYTSALAGTALAGGAIAAIGWFAPVFTRPFVFALFAFGAIKFATQKQIEFSSLRLDPAFLIAFPICLLLFRHFSYTQYFYNNHDPVYWGYAFELLRADYFGPIRVPTYYPEQFAPTHILPSTAIASLSVFIPNSTLAKLIECRYLFVSLVIAGLLARIYLRFPQSLTLLALSALASFLIYELDLGYNILISSYFYVLLLGEIFLQGISARPDRRALLFFCLMLIIARGPIAYSAAALFGYYWVYCKEQRFTPQVLVGALIVVLVGTTWLIFPSPFSAYCLDLSFNIVNPTNIAELITIVQINEWLMPDVMQRAYFDLFKPFSYWEIAEEQNPTETTTALLITVPAILYVLMKFYVFPLWAINRIKSVNDVTAENRELLNGLVIYALASMLGWLFLRNGFVFAHQAHGYLLMSVLAFFSLTIATASNPRLLIALVPVALLFASAGGFGHLPFQGTFEQGIPSKHLVYDAKRELGKPVDFYKPLDGQEMWETELRALLAGARVRASDYAASTVEDEFFGPEEQATSIMPGWVVSESYLGNLCKSLRSDR